MGGFEKGGNKAPESVAKAAMSVPENKEEKDRAETASRFDEMEANVNNPLGTREAYDPANFTEIGSFGEKNMTFHVKNGTNLLFVVVNDIAYPASEYASAKDCQIAYAALKEMTKPKGVPVDAMTIEAPEFTGFTVVGETNYLNKTYALYNKDGTNYIYYLDTETDELVSAQDARGSVGYILMNRLKRTAQK